MKTPETQLLPCGHDHTSVIVVRVENGCRFRCTVCGAESSERECPEWFLEALSDEADEVGNDIEIQVTGPL